MHRYRRMDADEATAEIFYTMELVHEDQNILLTLPCFFLAGASAARHEAGVDDLMATLT
jgi:hypothetical protein